MREFKDNGGRTWAATVRELDGPDYKGRFHFVLRPADGEADGVELTDIQWNSARTAQRTLETMSVSELRRRLRSAVGRAGSPVTV